MAYVKGNARSNINVCRLTALSNAIFAGLPIGDDKLTYVIGKNCKVFGYRPLCGDYSSENVDMCYSITENMSIGGNTHTCERVYGRLDPSVWLVYLPTYLETNASGSVKRKGKNIDPAEGTLLVVYNILTRLALFLRVNYSAPENYFVVGSAVLR